MKNAKTVRIASLRNNLFLINFPTGFMAQPYPKSPEVSSHVLVNDIFTNIIGRQKGIRILNILKNRSLYLLLRLNILDIDSFSLTESWGQNRENRGVRIKGYGVRSPPVTMS